MCCTNPSASRPRPSLPRHAACSPPNPKPPLPKSAGSPHGAHCRTQPEGSPMTQRIVFLDRATIAPQIRVRPPSFAHELIEHAETRVDQVVERLAGASIAITNKVPITAAALERLPALKL